MVSIECDVDYYNFQLFKGALKFNLSKIKTKHSLQNVDISSNHQPWSRGRTRTQSLHSVQEPGLVRQQAPPRMRRRMHGALPRYSEYDPREIL